MSMNKREHIKPRDDDFAVRRQRLARLSDEELRSRFWSLTTEIVRPLIDLAYGHTTPSIERSVLLRMGFSSIEAKEMVSRIVAVGLLGKGAGHVVLKISASRGISSIREAGLELLRGISDEELSALFAEKGGDG
ncbi:ornithine aminomutase subunit alpha [Candidatus Bipolaricaulota bacterium]|nr:ornithine aminomutase subunit alpha [Candidatus Bipolaricaulota bacterium]